MEQRYMLNKYHQYVKDGINPAYDIQKGALGLAGEVGEVCDVVKKAAIYGRSIEDTTTRVCDELGDVIWQWMAMCVILGVSPQSIIESNIKKLNERHNGGENGRKSLR